MVIKKQIIILILGLLALTSLTSEAQVFKKAKSNKSKITSMAPTKAVEINGVILDIYDRKGQLDNLIVLRLSDISQGLEPRDPILTLLKDEDLGESTYRLAENLEEASREEDHITVLKVALSELEHNMRTKYN